MQYWRRWTVWALRKETKKKRKLDTPRTFMIMAFCTHICVVHIYTYVFRLRCVLASRRSVPNNFNAYKRCCCCMRTTQTICVVNEVIINIERVDTLRRTNKDYTRTILDTFIHHIHTLWQIYHIYILYSIYQIQTRSIYA